MKKILISFSIVTISGIILGGLQFNPPTPAPIVYQAPPEEDVVDVVVVNDEDEWLDEGVDDLACLLTDGKYENRAW
jgi:hypothetical protein